ncbi:Dipeptidyl peptidase 8 [Portunus trituberculatus]|uniref:Dipeptidyl peptidase 8 n=1 Tax=Portunus trituberculatus TaxID=210409 RepID=A0A5B7FPX4_PORTR|nr:Dipeptidyl peptidase 8 [Portunus trituberculatus]
MEAISQQEVALRLKNLGSSSRSARDRLGARQSQPRLVTAQLIQKIPLTSGEWSVTGTGLWVDEGRGLVYFTGLRDSPLENHLYVTSISHPGIIQRLTQSGFSHQVALDQVLVRLRVFKARLELVELPRSVIVGLCGWREVSEWRRATQFEW